MYDSPEDDFMIAPNGEDTTLQSPDGDLLQITPAATSKPRLSSAPDDPTRLWVNVLVWLIVGVPLVVLIGWLMSLL